LASTSSSENARKIKRALLYVRITVDGERREISVKENIEVRDWDRKKEIVRGKSLSVK
jgi:hypothetical protein